MKAMEKFFTEQLEMWVFQRHAFSPSMMMMADNFHGRKSSIATMLESP
jgi:hypothetical protein